MSKPTPIDAHIGQRIAARREQMGVSQASAGKTLGITYQSYSRIEKGTASIRASYLVMLAPLLGVSIGWFFVGAPSGIE